MQIYAENVLPHPAVGDERATTVFHPETVLARAPQLSLIRKRFQLAHHNCFPSGNGSNSHATIVSLQETVLTRAPQLFPFRKQF